ncbi:MAG: hypothetical protein A2676_03625 [Candidatus Sungbacteria bacterium RIFCSPHIGHO2_01_FULL_51_22]|nr:MAG: hypothetical protein A2676_03625 [Candidatus Sungbacteria bacterium RIFCSPHIGHO2_01_FULL_51_22]
MYQELYEEDVRMNYVLMVLVIAAITLMVIFLGKNAACPKCKGVNVAPKNSDKMHGHGRCWECFDCKTDFFV